jgi:hypothetical protein
MHNYEVVENPNHGQVLIKDKKEAICPFQPAIVTNQNGALNVMRLPCSTSCALAYLEEEEAYDVSTNQPFPSGELITKTYYVTNCGSSKNKYEVSQNVNGLKAI